MLNDSNKLDRILTKCIQSIEEKGWTVDDCMRHYAPYRTELEPMLKTVLKLRRGKDFLPSDQFRSNAHGRIQKQLHASRRSPRMRGTYQVSAIPRSSTTPRPRLRLAGSLITLLLVSLILITAGVGVAFAADNAIPGDALFQVDRAIERIRIQIQLDPQEAVRLHLQFATERIDEIINLIKSENSNHLDYALTEYKIQIAAIPPLITKTKKAGDDVYPLLSEASVTIITHEKKLEELIQSAPVRVGEAIQATIQDIENIRKLVVSQPAPDEPVAEATPKPMVIEPGINPTSTPILPPPTPQPTSLPPSTTPTVESSPHVAVDLVSMNLRVEPEIPEVNMVVKIIGDVKNLGTLNAGKFTVIFCADSSVEDCYQEEEGSILYIHFAYLAPGDSSTVHTYSWLPDSPGEYMVHICADIGHSVTESDETAASNCDTKSVTVLDSGLIPDLTITALDWPTEAYEDEDVVFFYRVTNTGTGTAHGDYINQLFVDGQLVADLGSQVGTRNGTTLVPGAVDSHGFVWRASCGDHLFTAKTDVNNQVSESNENNNTTLLHTITIYCKTN